MANDTILIPGGDHWEPPVEQKTAQYLEKDNYLSEYESESEKAVVRENLQVYDRNSVYTKLESDIKLDETVNRALNSYLNLEDPHGILPLVSEMIRDFVKNDGSTPFIAPLQGVDPILDFHLTTKRFVNKIIKDHINTEDPHNIVPIILDILEQYVKSSEVYFKSQLYTKNEIDKQSSLYLKKDGSTPFIKALLGADPLIDGHLATKRYVDKVIYNHLIDVDPHGFILILNNRLATYAKVSNVYDKTQTYSRVLLDSIIRSLVSDAAKEALQDHLNEFDPHKILNEVSKEHYVKQDGSVSFKAPLKGVDAVESQDLVTLHLVEEIASDTIWKTSGPVETTVGFVEDNTNVPEQMTVLEILDAIFYGKKVSLTVPEYVTIGNTGMITVCVHGTLALIQSATLYQDGEPIYVFDKSDFEEGCVTVESKPITKDTTFKFEVVYSNDTILEDTKVVKCSYPIFVGLLPKWKFANTVTMDYLKELATEDSENNKFLDGIPLLVILKYNFQDPKLRHPFIVTPADYPNLETIVTKSLSFGIEAFDVIDMIPLTVQGIDIVYKMYVYRLALSSLNLDVTFNFK